MKTLFMVMLLSLLAACGGGGGDTPTPVACTADQYDAPSVRRIVMGIQYTNRTGAPVRVEVSSDMTWQIDGNIAAGNVLAGWLTRSTDPHLGYLAHADYSHTVNGGESSWNWRDKITDTVAPGETVTYVLAAWESHFDGCLSYAGPLIALQELP